MKASAKPKSQKVEDRDYHRGSAALRRDLHSNPHFIARPSARALAHRPANGLWSEPEMKLAREEFYIPSGTRVIILCPELFDRDLMKYSSDHKKRGKAIGEHGMMTICPSCKTNYYVKPWQWSCSYGSIKKSINQELTQDVIVCKCKLKLRLKDHFKKLAN